MAAVTDRDLGWKKIKREMARATQLEVAVGILEGSGSNEDGTSIAEYATYNEYGTENIPSRPFMRTAFDENVGDIARDMEAQSNALVTGARTARQALTIIGQKQADRIKNTITGRDFLPKLADSTIRAKKGSTKTLVDTAALTNAVQPSVRAKTR